MLLSLACGRLDWRKHIDTLAHREWLEWQALSQIHPVLNTQHVVGRLAEAVSGIVSAENAIPAEHFVLGYDPDATGQKFDPKAAGMRLGGKVVNRGERR